MIRAVLFDLDGTLFDHYGAADSGLAAHLAQVLPDLAAGEVDAVLAEWRRLEFVHFDEYLAGEVSFQGQRRRRVRGLLDAPGMSDADADDWFAGYRRHYERCWAAFHDVAPMLEALARLLPAPHVGIVTNGETELQHTKLASLGLAEHFPLVLAADEVGIAKPDPEIFHTACEQLDVAPAETVYVGDLFEVDALGAARAGLVGVWLRRNGAGASARPGDDTRTIASLHELVDLLDDLGHRHAAPSR